MFIRSSSIRLCLTVILLLSLLLAVVISVQGSSPSTEITANLSLSAAPTAGAAVEGRWDCWNPTPGLPDPCQNSLNDVTMLSENDGWAVGDLGTILHWDGTQWQQIESPTRVRLLDVDAVSATDVWAVGGGEWTSVASSIPAVILHWDGSAWEQIETPPQSLRSISMTSASDGWAVGGYTTSYGDGAGFLMHWDGQTWSEVGAGSFDQNLRAVSMLSANQGWAVGDQGTILRWDGSAWNPVNSPTSQDLRTVEMLSATDVWAAGNGVVLHRDGQSWQVVDDLNVNSLAMLSANDGWAVGDAIYHWDGNNWLEIAPVAGYGIAMASSGHGWAVGYDGAILHWDGITWSTLVSPATKTYGPDMHAVVAVSACDAWMVGLSGNIKHWDGKNWQAFPSSTVKTLYGVTMIPSGDEGWTVGEDGTILHWDGSAWRVITSPTTKTLRAVEAISTNDVWAAGADEVLHWDGQTWQVVLDTTIDLGWEYSLLAVSAASANQVWVVGDSVILYWDGLQWDVQYDNVAPQFRAVKMLSADNGWAMGDWISGGVTGHVLYLMHWNVSEWEYVDVDESGIIYGLDGFATDLWAVGHDGKLLHWDGSQWATYLEVTTDDLYAVSMLSENEGWAVGSDGEILHYTTETGDYQISGRVTRLDDHPLSGATVSTGERCAITDASGVYTITNVVSGTYTLTPSLSGYTVFSPISRTVTIPPDAAQQDFIAYPPGLQSDYLTGKPGSTFTLTGSDFPLSSTVTLRVNGYVFTETLTSDSMGGFAFRLDTSQAEPGFYQVTVQTQASRAMIEIVLDENAPLRQASGSEPLFIMPAGIGYTSKTFLPMIAK